MLPSVPRGEFISWLNAAAKRERLENARSPREPYQSDEERGADPDSGCRIESGEREPLQLGSKTRVALVLWIEKCEQALLHDSGNYSRARHSFNCFCTMAETTVIAGRGSGDTGLFSER